MSTASTTITVSGARRPVTLADVARACELSKATVSEALNASDALCRVNRETRQRVREMALQLKYSPNWRAKSLSNGRTQSIGLLYPGTLPLLRGMYEQVLNCFAETIGISGYHLVFIPLRKEAADGHAATLNGRVDGCVVAGHLPEFLENVVEQAGLPTVILNARSRLHVPQVQLDDLNGSDTLTRHLLGLGHRQITFLFKPHTEPHCSKVDRVAGYERAMRETGCGQFIRVLESGPEEFAAAIAEGRERATGVIVYGSDIATELLQSFWRRNIQVPGDVSVATFGDVFPAAMTIPPLTVMTLAPEELGRLGARLLLDRLEGQAAAQPEMIALKEHIIVRGSTAAPREGRRSEAGEDAALYIVRASTAAPRQRQSCGSSL